MLLCNISKKLGFLWLAFLPACPGICCSLHTLQWLFPPKAEKALVLVKKQSCANFPPLFSFFNFTFFFLKKAYLLIHTVVTPHLVFLLLSRKWLLSHWKHALLPASCIDGRLVGKTGAFSLISEGKRAVLAKNSHASGEPTVLFIKKPSTYFSKLFNTLAHFFHYSKIWNAWNVWNNCANTFSYVQRETKPKSYLFKMKLPVKFQMMTAVSVVIWWLLNFLNCILSQIKCMHVFFSYVWYLKWSWEVVFIVLVQRALQKYS